MIIIARVLIGVKANSWYNLDMNASEIRKKFFEFQVKNGHKIVAPAPLVLEGDPTTLAISTRQRPSRWH